MFQWIRWNATIPSAFDTYTFGAVTFPGYYSEWDADAPVSPATSVYRPPLTKIVRIRERHEYVMSTTPWTTFTVIPSQLIQTATMAYVNYVDDNTITNAGALSPSSGTPPTLTYHFRRAPPRPSLIRLRRSGSNGSLKILFSGPYQKSPLAPLTQINLNSI